MSAEDEDYEADDASYAHRRPRPAPWRSPDIVTRREEAPERIEDLRRALHESKRPTRHDEEGSNNQ